MGVKIANPVDTIKILKNLSICPVFMFSPSWEKFNVSGPWMSGQTSEIVKCQVLCEVLAQFYYFNLSLAGRTWHYRQSLKTIIDVLLYLIRQFFVYHN